MSNPKHPIITFKVKLDRNRQETIGPVTNAKDTTVLHPDRHDNDQDRAIASAAQHDKLKSTYIPSFLVGENIIKNDDDTFTVYGMKAKYILDTYTTGDNALLEVVTNTSASESE